MAAVLAFGWGMGFVMGRLALSWPFAGVPLAGSLWPELYLSFWAFVFGLDFCLVLGWLAFVSSTSLWLDPVWAMASGQDSSLWLEHYSVPFIWGASL